MGFSLSTEWCSNLVLSLRVFTASFRRNREGCDHMRGSLPERSVQIYCYSTLTVIEFVRIVEWDMVDKVCPRRHSYVLLD